jgi:peptidoglycan/xylan/chitin deacetylase (PgdA/CDA1 family)
MFSDREILGMSMDPNDFASRNRRKTRKLLALLFRLSGLPLLIKEIVCRNRATIIVYHDPAPEVFEAHLAYLVSHFNVIPLEQLVQAIQERKIPPQSLCITFDDGHRNNFALLDIIKRYQVSVTIYVCAQIVDTQRHYWFVDFADQAQQLKSLPHRVRLQRMASVNGYRPEKEFTMRQALSKPEMLELSRQGVDFQSHALGHPVLTTCSDEECWSEIAESKQVLEDLIEKPVAHFAYPNGNYSEREMAYLRKAGYRSGRTIDVGWNGPHSSMYALKSMVISDDATLDEMIAQLYGVFPYFRYLRQGSCAGKHAGI